MIFEILNVTLALVHHLPHVQAIIVDAQYVLFWNICLHRILFIMKTLLQNYCLTHSPNLSYILHLFYIA